MGAVARQQLFLIDTFGFIFRAYHARARSGAPPMRTSTGFSTEAVYIFNNMLRSGKMEGKWVGEKWVSRNCAISSRVCRKAWERIMSELDRLHAIIDALPPQQIHALLTLLVPPQPTSDEEFARRLAEAPEEEVDEETIARILAAEAEQGESISHGELKQRLGL